MSLLANEEIELALLPIGGNYTMDTKDAVRAIDMIKPKKVIPMHYNTFEAIKADPKTLKNNALGIEVVIVHPMETIRM
jgi:L-ascorbate metabolism protein UlaG (beta-lactamase superfamily)